MPRSNRPRGRRPGDDENEVDLSRALLGRLSTESKRDGVWNVQPLAAASAAKFYLCPGCGLEIAPGVAHTVTWRADGLMGEQHDLADRRHWHLHCWRIKA
jgi:YD repeat-containing protein